VRRNAARFGRAAAGSLSGGTEKIFTQPPIFSKIILAFQFDLQYNSNVRAAKATFLRAQGMNGRLPVLPSG